MKKNLLIITILLFSLLSASCTNTEIIKTMFINGSFRVDFGKTETVETCKIVSGTYFSDQSGKYELKLEYIISENSFLLDVSGSYYIQAINDKNGNIIIEDLNELGFNGADLENYYFINLYFDDLGKITFVR